MNQIEIPNSHAKAIALDRCGHTLDRLYLYSGYLAAFFLVCIFATTMLQVASRLVGVNITRSH